MKRTLLLLILIFAFCLNAEIIEQTYRFDEYTISQRDGYEFLLIENTQLAGRTGEPALPYQAVALLLPPAQIAESVEFILSDKTDISGNFELYPMQPSRPLSQQSSGQFFKDENIYQSSAVFPAGQQAHLTTEFLNGYACALTSFTPVQYLPARGEISYFRKVTVKITTRSDPDFLINQKNLKSSAAIAEKIADFVQNPAMMISYLPAENSREGEYEIILITSPEFASAFEDWKLLNLKKGLITEIVTTTEIYTAMTGQDEPEKIRNYIIQEYQDSDADFVLLAGDAEVVPYRGLYCFVDSGGGYEDNDIPADLYYSALDGTWDDDNDGIWGEIGEDDLLPDIAVARMTFSNLNELDNMLNKTISYQAAPVLGELTSPLLAGENMYNDPLTWGGDYLDLLIGLHDDNGYTTEGIPVDNDYFTMYDRDLGNWTSQDLMAEINQGHPFIYHAGHASYNYGLRMSDWQITNTNFAQTNGIDHNFPLIYTHGCNCGGFDQSDCIAEYMLKIANFAVVFVGNSRYGWFNEGQTEGPSAHLNREFVDALYTDGTDFVARTHLESKIDTAPWVTAPGQWEEGALRWCFYDCNVLGDPTLAVWTAEPLELITNHAPVILLGTVEFAVNVLANGSPRAGLQCTLIQNNELIGTAATDAGGNALIEFEAASVVPGDIFLYVSGNNCQITEYPLQVVPSGTYVMVTDHSIFSGNDDVLEFAENALLSLTLQEIGNVGDAHNLVVAVSCTDPFITINDNLEMVGTLAAGASIELNNAFDFDVSSNIPDDYSFELLIDIAGDEGSWTSNLNLTAFAVDIHLENVFIDDAENGILDPGETAVLQMELMNDGGADAYNVQLQLQTSNPFVLLEMLPLQIDSLNAGATGSYDVCHITLAAAAPLGEIVNFSLEITADNGYYTDNDFALITGLLIEDFESGDFNELAWTFAGDADWTISSNAFEGTYSAQSGDIYNNNDSRLEINLQVTAESEISFWKKVSSEANYDYLRFYIDYQFQDEWSGEVDWSEESFNVQPGNRTFTWTYYKDQGVSTGDDCAWIDYIVFPDVNMGVQSGEEMNSPVCKLLGNYPNPFNPSTTIYFSTTESTSLRNATPWQAENTEISIYNMKGQKVKIFPISQSPSPIVSVIWDGTDDNGKPVASGIYLYRLKAGNYRASRKMLLMK